MPRRLIGRMLLMAMLPQLSGCSVWRVQGVPPAQAILQAAADSQPHDVRVRLRHDNTTLVIQRAGVVGDSIVGNLLTDWAASGGRQRRVAVALADVQELAVSEASPGRTVLALGVTAALVGVIAAVISVGSWHSGGLGGVRL